MLRHVRKGCYKDPLPLEQMSICLDSNDQFSNMMRLRSTSQGEAFNRVANSLVAFITAQLAELGDAKLWLHITRSNLAKNELLADFLGITPRSLYWYIHEALFNKHNGFSVHKGMTFPPEIPSWYDEPLGILFGRLVSELV